MSSEHLEPEQFQPKLLAVITPVEIRDLSLRLTNPPSGKFKNIGDMLDSMSSTPEERIRLQQISLSALHISRSGLVLDNISGVHIWSTTDPNTLKVEPILKPFQDERDASTAARTDVSPLTEIEVSKLIVLFRQNIKDIPGLTFRWLELPNSIKDVLSGIDRDELIKRVKESGVNSLYDHLIPKPTEDAEHFVEDTRASSDQMNKAGQYSNAFELIGRRLEEASQTFASDNQKWTTFALFVARAGQVNQLVESEGFGNFSQLGKFPSLAHLSIASDLMRADMAYGYPTDNTMGIGDSFGFASMSFLQGKIVERALGENAQVVYRNTLNPISKYEVPQDPEIAGIQRRILKKVQKYL